MQILYLIVIGTIQPLSYASVIRLWKLYFDYNRSLQSLSMVWKQQITKPQNDNNNEYWTFKYKCLGSNKVLFTLYAVLFLTIMAYLTCTIIFMQNRHLQSYAQWIGILPCLFLLLLIFKIRKCRDQFLIQKELTLFAMTNLFAFIFYSAVIVPLLGVSSILRIIIVNITMGTLCYAYCYISTVWVIHKYNKLTKETNVINSNTPMTLEQILTIKDGFDMFADHLVRQFCIENLLFLFEMMLVKNQLISKQLLDAEDVGVIIDMNIERIKVSYLSTSD